MRKTSLRESSKNYMEYSFLVPGPVVASSFFESSPIQSRHLLSHFITNNTVCCFGSREFCKSENCQNHNFILHWLKRACRHTKKLRKPAFVKRIKKKNLVDFANELLNRFKSPRLYTNKSNNSKSIKCKKFYYLESIRSKYKLDEPLITYNKNIK